MKILALDDSEPALKLLVKTISEVQPSAEVFAFDRPSELLTFAKENICGIAFLDIQMWGMNGLTVAKELKEINPKTNIIFVTAYAKYSNEAYNLYPSGYINKPVTKEAVEREIENLRYPLDVKNEMKVYVQTFGNFEIFIYGTPISFTRSKTKELLAYLVSRQGAWCSNNEIISVIWEDKKDSPSLKSLYRNLVSDLKQTLELAGIGDVLIKKRGFLAVVPEKLTCDLYDVCNGNVRALNTYMGEFMAQYTWAEFINAYLENMI